MMSLLVGTQQGRDYISSELAGGESSSGEVTAIKIFSFAHRKRLRQFDRYCTIVYYVYRQTKEKMKENVYITWFQKYKGSRKDK